MYTTLDALALLAVCLVAAATVVFVLLSMRRRVDLPVLHFVTLACASGVAALGSSVMYLAFASGGTTVSLIVGDALMVLAPSLIGAALLLIAGRSGYWAIVPCVAASAVAVVTATVAQPASAVFKILVLTVACTAVVVITVDPRLRHRPGIRVIAVVNALYALYCVGRLVVGAVWGLSSPLYISFFSTGPTTVVGTLAVAAIAWGVVAVSGVLSSRRRAPDDEDRSDAASGVALTARIVDFGLIRQTLGAEKAWELHRALASACSSVGRTVSERDGSITFTTALAPRQAETDVRAAYARATGIDVEGEVGDLAVTA